MKNQYFQNPIHKNEKIKNIFQISDEKNISGNKDYLSLVKDVGVVRYEERGNSGNKTSDKPENYKLVKKNDLVINPMNVTIGSVGVSDYSGCISGVYIILRPNSDINPKYYHYVFQEKGFQKYLKTISYGIMEIRESLNKTEFLQLKIPKPTIDDQNSIVDYLDQKIKKIDQIIENLNQKINSLEIYKSLKLDEILTKGLKNNQNLKKSDTEWNNLVPQHWKTIKLKYLLNHIIEKHEVSKDDIKISPENVISNTGECTNFYSEYEGEGFKFKNGDILLNKLRIYLKKILLVDCDGYSMGEMIVLRPKEKSISKYIYYLFFSDKLINYLNSLSTGVKMPRVSPERILSTKIPLPSQEEINEIVVKVENLFNNFKNRVSIDQKRISLLKQYKNTLISEIILNQKHIL